MIDWRTQYSDPERDEAIGRACAIECDPEDDLTQQQFRDDADINVMMRRFGVTGEIRTVDRQALQGDFSAVGDFQSALNAVRAAEAAFLDLPSELRRQLDNDPSRVGGWLSDDANRAEAIRLGLIDVPAPVEPIPVRVLPDLEAGE